MILPACLPQTPRSYDPRPLVSQPPLRDTIDRLQRALDRLHQVPNPSEAVVARIEELEARIVAAFVVCANASERMSFAQAREEVARLDEVDFLDWVVGFGPRDRVGSANHTGARVIHEFIVHRTALRPDWVRVFFEDVYLCDGTEWFVLPLPAWAAYVSKSTSVGRYAHVGRGVRAQGLRRLLSRKGK